MTARGVARPDIDTSARSFGGSQPLRIHHVQPFTLDVFGHRDEEWGTQVRYFLTHICAAQARSGDLPTVHLFTRGRSREMAVGGVRVRFHRSLGPPPSWSLERRFARQFAPGPLGAIVRERPDVVHFHGALSLQPYQLLVAATCRAAGLPLVSQDHGRRPVGRLESGLERLGLRLVTAALASNAEHVGLLAERGVPAERISFAPNGIDEVFRPDGPATRSAGDRFCILVVSRLSPDKDPMTMARAVRRVAATRPVHLTLVGAGDEGLRREVLAELRTSDVTIDQHTHLDQVALAERYRGADVLLLTSLREGFNQVTLEALACGLPVVASDIPGVRDGVGDAGVLVPAGRPELFAGALLELAADRERRTELRRAGLRQAQAFRWDDIVAGMRQAYLDAISARPTSRRRSGGPTRRSRCR